MSVCRKYPPGKYSTCSEECFSLARLNLTGQSCVVLRETFVQLGKSFRGGATTPKNIGIEFIIGMAFFSKSDIAKFTICHDFSAHRNLRYGNIINFTSLLYEECFIYCSK